MLRSLKDLEGYAVRASDGDVGSVFDFLFDDERWVVRHLVVDTGSFFKRRHHVLISPSSFRTTDWATRRFHLALTTDKIQNSPSVDVDQPVSRRHELAHCAYYGFPYYWGFPGAFAGEVYPSLLAGEARNTVPDATPEDVHLRSTREVRGYHIQGNDGVIGHVDDLIVEDATWDVRYLVLDTASWWLGKRVLVSPQWTRRISWVEKMVHVDVSRQRIKEAPAWDPSAGVNREYEARLYDYHGRPAYWNLGAAMAGPQSQPATKGVRSDAR